MSPSGSTLGITAVCACPFIINPLLFANLGAVELETSKEDDAQGDWNGSPYNLCRVQSSSQSLAERIALLLGLLLALGCRVVPGPRCCWCWSAMEGGAEERRCAPGEEGRGHVGCVGEGITTRPCVVQYSRARIADERNVLMGIAPRPAANSALHCFFQHSSPSLAFPRRR